jgi:hypothetical protein
VACTIGTTDGRDAEVKYMMLTWIKCHRKGRNKKRGGGGDDTKEEKVEEKGMREEMLTPIWAYCYW